MRGHKKMLHEFEPDLVYFDLAKMGTTHLSQYKRILKHWHYMYSFMKHSSLNFLNI